jgi:hypothetical protein
MEVRALMVTKRARNQKHAAACVLECEPRHRIAPVWAGAGNRALGLKVALGLPISLIREVARATDHGHSRP